MGEIGFIIFNEKRSVQFIFMSLLECLLDSFLLDESNKVNFTKNVDASHYYSYETSSSSLNFKEKKDTKLEKLDIHVMEYEKESKMSKNRSKFYRSYDEKRWKSTNINAENFIQSILNGDGNIIPFMKMSATLRLSNSIFVLVMHEMKKQSLKLSFITFHFLNLYSRHSFYCCFNPADHLLDLLYLEKIFVDLNFSNQLQTVNFEKKIIDGMNTYPSTHVYSISNDHFILFFSSSENFSSSDENFKKIENGTFKIVFDHNGFIMNGHSMNWNSLRCVYLNVYNYFKELNQEMIGSMKIFESTLYPHFAVPLLNNQKFIDLIFRSEGVTFENCLDVLKTFGARDLYMLEDFISSKIPFLCNTLQLDALSTLYTARSNHQIFDNTIYKKVLKQLSSYNEIPKDIEKYNAIYTKTVDESQVQDEFYHWLKSQSVVLLEQNEVYSLTNLINEDYILCYTSLLDVIPLYNYYMSKSVNIQESMETLKIVKIRFVKGKQLLLDFTFCDNPNKIVDFWYADFRSRDMDTSFQDESLFFLPFISGYISEPKRSFIYYVDDLTSISIEHIPLTNSENFHHSQYKKVKEFDLKKSLVFREHHDRRKMYCPMKYITSYPSLKFIDVPFVNMPDNLVTSFFLIYPKCSTMILHVVLKKIFGDIPSNEVIENGIIIETFEYPSSYDQTVLIYSTSKNPSPSDSETLKSVWRMQLVVDENHPHYLKKFKLTKDAFFQWMLDSNIFVSHHIEGNKQELISIL